MKAGAWILYALLCFGAATGTTLAVKSQSIGLPAASADSLMSDLDAITSYASEGRCDAVTGRANRAQSTVQQLPADTSDDLVRELQRSLDRVRTRALQECQAAANAANAEADRARELEEQLQREREQLEQEQNQDEPTTPDAGGNDPGGGPDPGTGEGTTPDGGQTGGITPGELGEQLRDGVDEMQQRTKETMREWRDRLRGAIQ